MLNSFTDLLYNYVQNYTGIIGWFLIIISNIISDVQYEIFIITVYIEIFEWQILRKFRKLCGVFENKILK